MSQRRKKKNLADETLGLGDDGLSPIEFQKKSTAAIPAKSNRRAKQLCRQVFDALVYVLCEVTGDENLTVLSVDPGADSSRMNVTVGVHVPLEEFDRTAVAERLEESKGRLRFEIASEINRRKTPDLSFAIVHMPS